MNIYDAYQKLGQLLARLKKAGFTDDMLEQISSADDNAPAEAMFRAYQSTCANLDHPKLIIIGRRKFIVPKIFSLEKLRESFNRRRWNFDSQIMAANFKPSSPLIPGTAKTAVFVKIKRREWMSKEEIIAYIEAIGGQLPNASGLAQAWESLKDDWPRKIWIAGFDHEDNLWKDESGFYRVTTLTLDLDRTAHFDLGCLDGGCDDTGGFLFFLD
jgi:hypothetical protein